MRAEWLHGDQLQQLQRAVSGVGRGGDDLKGGCGDIRAAGDAGVAHYRREILKQGAANLRSLRIDSRNVSLAARVALHRSVRCVILVRGPSRLPAG